MTRRVEHERCKAKTVTLLHAPPCQPHTRLRHSREMLKTSPIGIYTLTMSRRYFVSKDLFSDLTVTHDHEEKLRADSMALVHGDPEFSTRLAAIEKAMALIFGYTLEHTSRSDDEATVQMLQCCGIRREAGVIRILSDGVSAGTRYYGNRLFARLLRYVA